MSEKINISLYKTLNKKFSNKTIFLSKSLSVDLNSLLKERALLSDFLGSIYKKNVAIIFRENLNIAKWLFFLDGIVNSLTIIPYNFSYDDQQKLLIKSSTDITLKDQNLLINSNGAVNIYDILLKRKQLDPKIQDIKTNWILTTSGTTGTPKLVKHTLQSLAATSKKNNHAIWGLLYSLEKFAGLQVYLQALLSHSKLVITEYNYSLNETLNLFSKFKVTSLSATPSLWRKILMIKDLKLENIANISLGGEIATDNILNALNKRFPLAKIRHIYASTEAGSVFSVSDGLAGFPRKYLNNNYKNLKMKISNHSTLLIKSDSNAIAYLGDDILSTKNDYIDTGDVVKLENDRYYFLGRENGSINIGGNKVYPEIIEELLESYPGVSLAKVSSKKSSIIGNLLIATVVIKDMHIDLNELEKLLREYCIQNLSKEITPSFFNFTDSLDLSFGKKIARNDDE